MDQTQTAARYTHYVKFREVGKKAWWFLASGGSGSRLRVHALRFTESQANEEAEGNTRINPGFEFKAVPMD